MRRRGLFLLIAIVMFPIGTSWGAFHLMKVVEVFPGTPAAPDAQYVVLQMYSGGQNFVGGHSIDVFDASGAEIGSFTFPGSVSNGSNQAKILIGTSQAATFFDVANDLTMTAILPMAGGKVCFDLIDCVAWGSYAGSSTGVGTPFNATGGGLRPGRATARRLDIAGSASNLDSTDDTNDSANDFVFAAPAPRNNAGSSGTVPAATCGDGAVAGLEICDDGNTEFADGCRGDCAGNEVCGDGIVDDAVGETCDDGNTSDGDACAADCGIVMAGVPEEASADGSLRVDIAPGTAVDVFFAPACAATDHAAYVGRGPFDGGVEWTESFCGLGSLGAASLDPGDPLPGEFLYFVVVGYNDASEGSYGVDGAGSPRPEALGVGACDRPVGAATCP